MANDALINLVDWCKRERASLRQRLELMKAGKFRIGEKEVGREWVDTTPLFAIACFAASASARTRALHRPRGRRDLMALGTVGR
jgi:hypothetical protein